MNPGTEGVFSNPGKLSGTVGEALVKEQHRKIEVFGYQNVESSNLRELESRDSGKEIYIFCMTLVSVSDPGKLPRTVWGALRAISGNRRRPVQKCEIFNFREFESMD